MVVHVLVAVLLTSGRATAETPREEAAALTSVGVKRYEERRYEEAEQAFSAAYRLAPLPALLYDLGRVRAALGHHAEAADTLQRFANTLPPGTDRAEVEALVAEERSQAATTAPSIATEHAAARLVVAERAAVAPRRFAYPATVALAGVGVALIASSLGTGVASQHLHDQLTDRCAAGCTGVADDAARGDRLRVASIVTLSLGAVSLAGGAIALFLEHRQARR